MESPGYIDFYFLAKDLNVRRGRIFEWCRYGLRIAREPTPQERELVRVKENRAYLRRVGVKDPRTKVEWVNAFLSVVTPE